MLLFPKLQVETVYICDLLPGQYKIFNESSLSLLEDASTIAINCKSLFSPIFPAPQLPIGMYPCSQRHTMPYLQKGLLHPRSTMPLSLKHPVQNLLARSCPPRFFHLLDIQSLQAIAAAKGLDLCDDFFRRTFRLG